MATIKGCHRKGLGAPHKRGAECGKPLRSKSLLRANPSRSGRNYYKGDRVRRGNWSHKRWGRAQEIDRKRSGRNYESWEQ